MSSINKKSPDARGIPQPFNRQAGHAPQHKPVVAQLKTGVSAQSVKQPVAPPAYRPQATPKAAQSKMIHGALNRKSPVAPPVYRLQQQQTPKTAQPKMAQDRPSTIQPKVNAARLAAPAVYRPQNRSQSVQPKMENGAQVKKSPLAPPVYSPQPVPKVLQTKAARQQMPAVCENRRTPVSRPACRPQLAPNVLQSKNDKTRESARIRSGMNRPIAPIVAKPGNAPRDLPRQNCVNPAQSLRFSSLMLGATSNKQVGVGMHSAAAKAPMVIQRKIELTQAYKQEGKVKDAYEIFLASFQRHPTFDYFNDSDKVIVWFGVGDDEPDAEACTRHGIHLEPVTESMVSQKINKKRLDLRYYNEAREHLTDTPHEIIYRVILSDSAIDQSPASVLASILAHEVGTHVIPHEPMLRKMEGGERLGTAEEKYFKDIHETNQRNEHLAIRNRTHDHYESMIRDMVTALGRQSGDARAVSEHYLNDISRYDQTGEPFSLNDYDAFLNYRVDKPKRDNWQSIDWMQEQLPQPQLRWTPAQGVVGAALIATAAVGYYLKYVRK